MITSFCDASCTATPKKRIRTDITLFVRSLYNVYNVKRVVIYIFHAQDYSMDFDEIWYYGSTPIVVCFISLHIRPQ
jgi:hypothetical protein